MVDFGNISYLTNGNERQKQAYKVLVKHHIFDILAEFEPVLTGTIPIEIDIPDSDLDICCYWKNSEEFYNLLKKSFSEHKDFFLSETLVNGQKTIIANFKVDGFEMEIFGQNIPTKKQNAFKHMLIEHKILLEKGEEFRRSIVELKLKGYKTEPAFAKLLGLKGNAYLELLNYKL
ncbi:MAG: DUF4269 domain-containing protein [Pedobacter sp.]|nr:MAG: DUF4269 domain-containing protein [Pedobacter sp.]